MLSMIVIVCFRILRRSARHVGCGCGASRRADPLTSVRLDLKLVERALGDPPKSGYPGDEKDPQRVHALGCLQSRLRQL